MDALRTPPNPLLITEPDSHEEALRHAKILIVDDNQANIALLERILRRAHFDNFISTTSSQEVVAIFQDFQPDLIVTDWNMPSLDGGSLISRLRDLMAPSVYLPIVVVTADNNPEIRQRALATGATDFLTNPFDPLEVLLRIKNLLHSRLSYLKIQDQNKGLEASVRSRTVDLARALEELKETQEQVIRQERLVALGTMASGIAHDFNNSLTVIMGFGQALLEETGQDLRPEKAALFLTRILAAARDAADIVRRLRQFYRPVDAGVDEGGVRIDLNLIVEEAIALTAPKWKNATSTTGHDITVVTHLGSLPAIAGQPAELREALVNLIFNAVDAMPMGGTMTCQTQAAGKDVLLEVADSGTGMTEEARKRCFEPFFTTKGERGTGLGLAMIFGIVQRHSGKIEVESTLGQGTTFTLRFPAADT